MDKEQPIDPKVRGLMNQIGHAIGAATPPGYGFAFLMFETNTTSGRMNYISNCRRADMLRAMKEFIAKSEAEHGSAQ